MKGNPDSLPWRPGDCARCPVPDILNANASPDMELTLTKLPVMLGLGRRLALSATCLKHHQTIEDPFVGCPRCNAERGGLDAFYRALEQDE